MNTEATLSEKTEEAAAATVDQAQDVSSDAVEAAKETVESAVSSAEETIASTSDTMIDAVTAGQQQTLEAANRLPLPSPAISDGRAARLRNS